MLALRWSSVDLDAGTIRIEASLERDGRRKTTKTDRHRPIALDPSTVAELRRWRSAQRARALAVGVRLAKDPYVLSHDPDSGTPWQPNSASQRFRRLCARAGVEGVRLHDLRHAHATWLLRAGVDPMTVAARVGHSRTSTTLNVYGHVMDGADRAAAEVMGRLLG